MHRPELDRSARPSVLDNARCMAAPHDVHRAGSDVFLVQPATGGPAHELDSQGLALLQTCSSLAPASQHAARAAGALGYGNPQALLGALGQLQRSGLVVDEQTILRLACAHDAPDPAPLETLFIRSSGRFRALRRALDSLVRHSRSLRRCVVLDDTRDRGACEAIDEVVDELAPRLDCELIHFRREDRKPLIKRLAGRSGADSERLGWLVGLSEQRTDAYGSGINLALLLAAGQRLLLLDDDASLDACGSGSIGPTRLTNVHSLAGSALDPKQSPPRRPELDPIAAHETHLGKAPGELAEPPAAAGSVNPDLLLWLQRGGRVRITSNGVYGDPGTRQPHWMYCLDPRALPDWRSDAGYRRSLHERRLLRREAGPCVVSEYSAMTTTLTGLDNSELIPPTLPFSVGEDTTLGELVRYVDPGSWLHAAPWMLHHEPEQPRHWERSDAARPMTHNVGTFFKQMLIQDGWARLPSDPSYRLESLRVRMQEIAASDRDVLERELLRQTLESRARLCTGLDLRRREWADVQHVADDIDRMAENNRQGHWHSDDDPECQIDTIVALAGPYAAALNDWQLAWCAAAESNFEDLTK